MRRSSASSAAPVRARPASSTRSPAISKPRRGSHPHQRRVRCSTRAAASTCRPQQRRVGYVFQDALLFPHLDVRIEPALRPAAARAGGCASSTRRASSTLLGLGALLQRKPEHAVGRREAAGRDRPRAARPAAHPAAWTSRSRRSTSRASRRSSTTSSACATSSTFRSSTSATRSPRSRGSPTRVVVLSDGKCVARRRRRGRDGPTRPPARDRALRGGSLLDTTGRRARSRRSADDAARSTAASSSCPASQRRHRRARARAHPRARRVARACASRAGISILNVLPGRVTAIDTESPGPIVDVQLAVGERAARPRASRGARCEQLGIHVGQDVYALVKAVSFDQRSVGYA